MVNFNQNIQIKVEFSKNVTVDESCSPKNHQIPLPWSPLIKKNTVTSVAFD
jgi:hypothetical protein